MRNGKSTIIRYTNQPFAGLVLVICLLFAQVSCQAAVETPMQDRTAADTSIPPTTFPNTASALPVPQTSQPVEARSLEFDPAIQGLEDLRGLPIRKFFDESYKLLLLRSPQKVTELGLAPLLGMREDRLDDLSDAGLQATQALERNILELLKGYERDELSETERTSHDVYTWYLETQVAGQACADYRYELTHFLGSYQFNLEQLLTELHTLETVEDGQDYVSRLQAVEGQVDGLLASLRRRAESGILPPRYMLQAARQDLLDRLGSTSSANPSAVEPGALNVYTHFSAKVAAMPDLSDEQKAELIQQSAQAIQTSFIPAYQRLIEFINEHEDQATDEAGLWKFPQGEACYRWLLQRETSSDLTAEQIHQLGLEEVERIRGEMDQLLDQLPYLKTASLNERLRMAQDDIGYINLSTSQGKQELHDSYTSLLSAVGEQIAPFFLDQPSQKLEVVVDENCGAAYYVPGSLDGKRQGAFHSCTGGGWMPRSSMATIAYHEGVPGHHFQIALSRELNLPLFQYDVPLTGYVEGWALYAELLAAEIGMYQDDPHGDLARLQYELLRAARLVADTGIHAKKWTRQETQAYLNRTLGGFEYEADRYTALPAQATSYKVGMLKILELRQMAEEALGERFDLAEFHQVVLGSGSLPLEILEQKVQGYIQNTK